jgi:hypothetical protein
MQKIQKPATAINIAFSLVIALGAIAFISAYELTEASSLQSFCQRQYNISFFREITPTAQKRCSGEFEIITREWTAGQYNNSLQK